VGADRRHGRVRRWTKSVNIFEKDFIIVPINKKSHWSRFPVKALFSLTSAISPIL
jgi:hypothetical protein